MNDGLPHVPRSRTARSGSRCSAESPFVFAVVQCDAHGSAVWAYTALPPAERKFNALKRRFLQAADPIRLQLKYVHLDCESPEQHALER